MANCRYIVTYVMHFTGQHARGFERIRKFHRFDVDPTAHRAAHSYYCRHGTPTVDHRWQMPHCVLLRAKQPRRSTGAKRCRSIYRRSPQEGGNLSRKNLDGRNLSRDDDGRAGGTLFPCSTCGRRSLPLLPKEDGSRLAGTA